MKRILLLLALVTSAAHAQTLLPKAIKTGPPIVYSVKMETTFVVPDDKRRIEAIRVYHALPTLQPWSKSNAKYGASEIEFAPSKVGKFDTHRDTDSTHLLFTLTPVQKPSTKLTFTSRMKITSVDRTLDYAAAKVTWKDYLTPPKDKTAVVSPQVKSNVPAELVQLAEGLKQKHNPPEGLRAMAVWVEKNITYDASVTYPANGVAEICKAKRGHCGHRALVFEHLAAAAGVPMRTVFGLNLYTPDGRTSDLQKIRSDFTNVHTWAEVYLPGIGWVEFDPGLGDKAFNIPSSMIQNNRWFQNYAIWFKENGTDKMPTWTPIRGGFRSDYGVENIISYTTK